MESNGEHLSYLGYQSCLRDSLRQHYDGVVGRVSCVYGAHSGWAKRAVCWFMVSGNSPRNSMVGWS